MEMSAAERFGGCGFLPDFSHKSKYTDPNTKIQAELAFQTNTQIQILGKDLMGAVFTQITRQAGLSHKYTKQIQI